MDDEIVWLSSAKAADRIGITQRILYRLIDRGHIAAYQIGRVIRLTEGEVDAYINRARIEPGDLRHLYPDPSGQD